MPVTGRGVTVRGGRKLARFVSQFDQASRTAQAKALVVVIRNHLFPALVRVLPERTGALKRSLRVERRGVNVRILIAFYWRWQRIGSTRQRIDEWAIDWILENKTVLRAAFDRELRLQLGL
ncbi:MAG: hypothetical protein OXI15_03115 [Chromatiales bacterium]|nr:hypothetical protein [Chromatiales bacterium]